MELECKKENAKNMILMPNRIRMEVVSTVDISTGSVLIEDPMYLLSLILLKKKGMVYKRLISRHTLVNGQSQRRRSLNSWRIMLSSGNCIQQQKGG